MNYLEKLLPKDRCSDIVLGGSVNIKLAPRIQRNRPKAHIWCVDPSPSEVASEAIRILLREDASRVCFLAESIFFAAWPINTMVNGSIDAIAMPRNMELEDNLLMLAMYLPILKPGGFLVGGGDLPDHHKPNTKGTVHGWVYQKPQTTPSTDPVE